MLDLVLKFWADRSTARNLLVPAFENDLHKLIFFWRFLSRYSPKKRTVRCFTSSEWVWVKLVVWSFYALGWDFTPSTLNQLLIWQELSCVLLFQLSSSLLIWLFLVKLVGRSTKLFNELLKLRQLFLVFFTQDVCRRNFSVQFTRLSKNLRDSWVNAFLMVIVKQHTINFRFYHVNHLKLLAIQLLLSLETGIFNLGSSLKISDKLISNKFVWRLLVQQSASWWSRSSFFCLPIAAN